MTEMMRFAAGVTLVGGAAFAASDLSCAQAIAPHLVAADRGADALIALGIVPEAVIGDMDSLRGQIPSDLRVLRIGEQETTDFEKCLTYTDAPFFVGIGFQGGRLDHTLAVLHGLMRHRGGPVVLIGETDVVFAAPRAWSMDVVAGDRVSFFPIVPCRGIASTGLHWPIDGLDFAAGTQIGTSNMALGGRVSAEFDGTGIVTILPKSYFEAAVESLLETG